MIDNGPNDDDGESIPTGEREVQIAPREFGESSSQRWENGLPAHDQPEMHNQPF